MHWFTLSNLSRLITRRISILIIAGTSILLTAGSCSFPGLNNNQQVASLGVLKRDPTVREDGFGRINAVISINGERINDGLAGISGLEIVQLDNDSFVYITRQKGIFLTDDGGRSWTRKYIIPVGSDNSNQNERDQEIRNEIAQNDAILLSDVVFDSSDISTWYVSGKENNVGKIYVTSDGGETFREIYSEVESNIGVLHLAINSANPRNLYAVLEQGALISSTDQGLTWQKVRNFRDTPVQLGFVSEFNNLVFVLFQNAGLFTSSDNGVSWQSALLKKTPPQDSSSNQSNQGNQTFTTFDKIVPVTSSSSGQWILLADRQIWVTDNLSSPFTIISLPLQSDQFDISDVAPHPEKGLELLYVSIDDRLFVSDNRGQSWSTGDKIQLPTPIGNIGQILLDRSNPEIIYLVLVAKNTQRNSGFLGGL